MAEPELNFDGPWYRQFDEWSRKQLRPRPFTNDAVTRASYGLSITLARKPGMPRHFEQVTVRHVITKTRDELLALGQIGPQTMKVVMAFLEAHDITELGPANASR
ncbi:MAG: hypothetical protein NT039_02960 [Candidatus Berkelbacteria bacterium]|nr:hypothetical protein [Candidatus Berkelbacteria bacterium]